MEEEEEEELHENPAGEVVEAEVERAYGKRSGYPMPLE